MKIYIPEIGDEITLTKDWTFTLYPETRNSSLANLLGMELEYINYPYGYHWVSTGEYQKPDIENYNVKKFNKELKDYQKDIGFDRNSYYKDKNEFQKNDPGRKRYIKDMDEWQSNVLVKGTRELKVTLKKGTVLTIDQIHIREEVKDYSNMTFYLSQSPDLTISLDKKTRPRFWVKLNECNNIHFM